MCGIAGFFGRRELSPKAVEKTLKAMSLRGPDSQHHVEIEVNGARLHLLHSRLSIIDLNSRADQPFERYGNTLVYNGEIYNYVELREELRKSGSKFTTESDTEVLVESYQRHGTNCLRTFEGMWAFALYDRARSTLVLSRDRFGEKPLYLYESPDGTYFASEIKFLQAMLGERLRPNTQQVLRYLVNGYKSLYKHEQTFFEGVRELEPSSYLEISQGGLKRVETKFWEPKFAPQDISTNEAIDRTRELLTESMRLRLRSDVPVAFCLSGGVDSGSLASIASKKFGAKVKSFSIIDSDERYNERKLIESTIRDLGCENHVVELKPEPNLARMEDIVAYHDAPIATITYYVHSYLSEAISRGGFRVSFSGTAADELFTGYYDHFNLHLYEMRNRPDYQTYLEDWKANTGRWVRNPILKDPDLYAKNINERGHVYLNNDVFATYLHRPFREEFVEKKFTDSVLRNRMLNELFHEATRVILHEDDLNSMRFSVENRSPFLDTNLFEFAYSIPNHMLIQRGFGKFILREAMKGILNEPVRTERQKKGFNASIHSVVNFESPQVRESLLDGPIYQLVNREKISELFSRNPLDDSFNKFLFSFVNAKIFLDQHPL